jgi:hypothetical protein
MHDKAEIGEGGRGTGVASVVWFGSVVACGMTAKMTS